MWPLSRKPEARREIIVPTLMNSSPENPSTSLSNPAAWLFDALGSGRSFAGPMVNEQTAMRSTAVYRAVALKAGVIASLPLKVYKRTEKGREEAVSHWLYPLLADNPNELMSGFIWKELIVCNLMLKGKHYSVIEYDRAGRPVALLPHLGQTTVERVKGRNRYTFHFNDGQEVLDQEDVIHVPGLGFDGINGISPIAWAGRQAIGTSLALTEFVGRMHANGARPSGVYTPPAGKQTPEGMARLRAELDAMHAGGHNAGRTMIADHGSKWEQMQMTLHDAQTLEAMRFSVADIARLFGVPPHMLGETDKTSSWGTGVEQQTKGFQIYNLEPELSRIEGELNRKLFVHPYYCEFSRDAINAMDAKTQSELFASAFNNGRMTPHEIRRKLNLPDVGPEGDKLYVQGAVIPLADSGKVPRGPQPPKAPSEPEPPPTA
ncbi:phage portal protein [Reyranella sp.]|uniref:phage portal protein n=1 Tax=Reyranella sp. TaxID=1929291 RepID=UPI0027317BB4|nr:phage portal protein [Reyranella sp.]MDP2377775.1 phage portal protein [Reyranella sp.]